MGTGAAEKCRPFSLYMEVRYAQSENHRGQGQSHSGKGRGNLNRLYDAFNEKYGLINNRGNYLAFAADESYFLLCSLEVLDDEGNFKRKADMFTKRTIKPHREITSVETASEALALSIGEKARVDLDYMAKLTGKTQEEIVTELQGVIFRVPNTEPARYVAADEYLSGDVREKLKVAQIAAKSDPALTLNVEALKQVIPKDLSAAEISVRLGTVWIPESDIQQFVMELLTPSSHAAGRIKVRYTPYNGDWFIENKTSDYGNVKADSTYGTKRASAYRIIEDTLNLKDTRIFDYVYDENGNKKAVFNHKETTAAQAKQEAIKQAFDAYLYQLVEGKQKFISQIMTSKSPVRSAEDVDEVALSFAEVKMLATGDERFKEKMDLDMQVAKLKVLKQSYLSEHYDLEDRILKYFPQTIKEYEERMVSYESDAALAEQHKPQGEEKFCPMTLKGVTYTEKADAGEMLLAACKENPLSNPVEIGSYRGFKMEVYYDSFNTHYCLNLCGKAKHKVDLGSDALGNLTRIENEIGKIPARLEAAKTRKAETLEQLANAKTEVLKPFAFEDELKEKNDRLNALNIELNLDEKDTSVMDTEPEQTEEQPERKTQDRER